MSYRYALIILVFVSGCRQELPPEEISQQTVADTLHLVLSTYCRAYERLVLSQQNNKIFPSQLFGEATRIAQEKGSKVSYVILSQEPLNPHNRPITESEKIAVDFIYTHPGQAYYGEEKLGKVVYFIAAYPEVGERDSCITCHNTHLNATKKDYQLNDVMGAMFIRLPKRI